MAEGVNTRGKEGGRNEHTGGRRTGGLNERGEEDKRNKRANKRGKRTRTNELEGG